MDHQRRLRVLYVDDDAGSRDLTQRLLEQEHDGFTVETAAGAEEGLERVADCWPDCVVSDYDMPNRDGIDFLRAVRETHPELPFIMFTAKGSESVAAEAVAADATDYLQKGSGPEQCELLANRIDNAVQARRDLTQVETLFENSRDALFLIDVTDESYRFRRVNPAYERLTGLSSEDLRGETLAESMRSDDAAAVAERYDRCVDQREPRQYVEELAVPRPESYWETRIAPVVVDGSVEYIAGSTRDITDRRRRLREGTEGIDQYRAVVDNYPGGAVFVYGQDAQVVRAGGTELPEVDPSSEELVGTTPQDVYPTEIATALTGSIEAAFAGERQTFEQAYEGQHYRIRVAPVQTDDGAVTHCLAVVETITERKRRQDTLQRRSRAFEAAPVGITVTDATRPDSPIVDANDRFVGLTGYSRDDVLGRTHRFMQSDRTGETAAERLRTGVANQEPVSTELRSHRKDGTAFRSQVDVAPVRDETGDVVNHVWFEQDITEQKRDRQRLQRREQTLRELHAATREFYPPSDESEIAEFLLEFLSGAFELPYVSVKRFDDRANCLQPAARSSSLEDTDGIGPVEPGPNPLWSAYEQGELTTFDAQDHPAVLDGIGACVEGGLAVPVGNFGVVVLCVSVDDSVDDVARGLVEVVTANAESAFKRLRGAETHADVAAELSARQDTVDELTTVTGVLQDLHADLAAKDTTESLERSVCDHLTRTDRIDFACLYRPEGAETNLQPITWAGRDSGYLNDIDFDGDDSLPAQSVVDDHEHCSVADIGSRATEADWAKHALTAGFRSVFSAPLVHDGVLYGVLSAYATDEEAFDRTHSDFVVNTGSLLVSYNRTLTTRYGGTQRKFTMLEFELSDSAYPFHRLAATTDCRIQVDTVLEATDTEMQLLVTVLDGDPETVLHQAPSVTTITDADRFGDQSDQLSVRVQKPFLASVVGKHDAALRDAVSGPDGTDFRVRLPHDTPKRPVLESLFSEYQEISPVKQRQITGPGTLDTTRTEEILTDRQREVLSAAFHGGYYETPKAVTGADIAANFGISNSAVHDHLRTANRKLLEVALNCDPQYQQ